MSKRSRRSILYFAPAGLLALSVLGIYALQAREIRASAEKTVGVILDDGARGVEIVSLAPGGPAESGGLAVGDVLVEIDGHPILQIDDYDIPAARFVRGRPATYRILRGDRELTLEISPGRPVEWLKLGIDGFAILCCLGLALMTLGQRPGDLRARLLVVFLFLLAFDLALHFNQVGLWIADVLSWTAYFLVAGAQIGVELHLASVIPERRRWLARRRWLVPLYYAFGLGLGVLTTLTYVVEEIAGKEAFPWTSSGIRTLLEDVALPVCRVIVLLILVQAAARFPRREGRLQAGLISLGVLPRVLHSLALLGWPLVAGSQPYWLESLYPLSVLFYPAAVFVAIFRYHLFDIEVVMRRSLLYTSLTGVLVVLFYAFLAAGGALFSRLVEGEGYSIWVVSFATLVLGLTFGSLRRWLQQLIDRRFFPERQKLRQRLIDLASELPTQGKVPRMGSHLVHRLSGIFAVSSATLLLTDPRSGLLLSVASSRQELDRRHTLSLLLAPGDPGIELLRRAGKPLPAERLAKASPALEGRLDLLEADLVAPLLSHERLTGALILGRPETGRRFTAEETELLNLFAHQVASAFENVRLFESATYESLTGLLRREAILDLLEKEVERAQRYRRPLAIGFADLDHFKAVNDRYGHLAGDALLKRVSEELSSALRSTDAIGRYGGEEFLMVFPETDLEGAATVAEKIRGRIERLRIPMDDGSEAEVRISIGLAALNADEPTPEPVRSLIATADQALYRAKAGGRNRVEPAAVLSAG